MEQVRGIANTDVPDARPVQPQLDHYEKPVLPTTHGGDPASPNGGDSKDYAATRPTKDGVIGGLFGAVAGGIAGGPLGALAGGVAGSMLDDNKLGSGGGQDEHYSSHNQRIAMDAKAYEAMFPDASRIALDGWAGVQSVPRQTSSAMSSRNAVLYDEMFPTARRINR